MLAPFPAVLKPIIQIDLSCVMTSLPLWPVGIKKALRGCQVTCRRGSVRLFFCRECEMNASQLLFTRERVD